jgi:3-oxoacyl-[acyl-carrier-protein] synthase II
MALTDHQNRPTVVITGAGVVTSLGQGKATVWSSLIAGKSGIRRISRFPIDGLKTTIAGTCDFARASNDAAPDLSFRLAELAVDEAVVESRAGQPGNFPGPLFMAVPPVELEWAGRFALADELMSSEPTYPAIMAGPAVMHPEWLARFAFGGVAERIAERFGTKGSPISLSTACASGATAIQLAVEAIRRGECEAAIAAGTDGSIHAEALIRFSLLSALSTANEVPEAASKPFSKNRDGFVMAEGAAALVLESYAHAKARGATILGVLAGCGERADSFHRTRSNPDGKAIISAIENALGDAGVAPTAIDYVNAHGTGTPENDKMEHLACAAVFGERMKTLPISSNKSMIGHTLTAAGAVEAVVSLLTIRNGMMPPTINHNIPDPLIELDVIPGVARAGRISTVMSNSFGFGGQNVVLVVAAEPT